jgi:hypothetical protein
MTSTESGAGSELKWQPPAKAEELFVSTAGNKFASINRPTAGAREELAVPVGDAPFQFYSLSTPNGQKPGILLEELGIDYDAHSMLTPFQPLPSFPFVFRDSLGWTSIHLWFC